MVSLVCIVPSSCADTRLTFDGSLLHVLERWLERSQALDRVRRLVFLVQVHTYYRTDFVQHLYTCGLRKLGRFKIREMAHRMGGIHVPWALRPASPVAPHWEAGSDVIYRILSIPDERLRDNIRVSQNGRGCKSSLMRFTRLCQTEI